MTEIVDKIIQSLQNNLEEWDAEWQHFQTYKSKDGATFNTPSWLWALYHPKGIRLFWSHQELDDEIRLYFIDEEKEQHLISYHKGEGDRITKMWHEVTERLREAKDIEVREYECRYRLKLKEVVKEL